MARPRDPQRDLGEQLLRDGWRDIRVAQKLGVSREAVRLWRRALPLPKIPRSGFTHSAHPRALPAEVRWKAEQLLRRGTLFDYQIAERVGVSAVTVGVWRRELGLPPRMPPWWQSGSEPGYQEPFTGKKSVRSS